MAADHCSPRGGGPSIRAGAPPPPGPWHSRLSPSLPGSLFSGSPWPPRAGFTCQRRFRPEQKTRPLTASPGARLPWRRRPRGQAASNHSCWIRLARALMLGAQTQRHPAGASGPAASLERPSPWGPGRRPALRPGPVPTEAPRPRPLAPTPPAPAGPGTPHLLAFSPGDRALEAHLVANSHPLSQATTFALCLKGTCRCLDGEQRPGLQPASRRSPSGTQYQHTVLLHPQMKTWSPPGHLSTFLGTAYGLLSLRLILHKQPRNQSWMHLRAESQASGPDLQHAPPPLTHTLINRGSAPPPQLLPQTPTCASGGLVQLGVLFIASLSSSPGRSGGRCNRPWPGQVHAPRRPRGGLD